MPRPFTLIAHRGFSSRAPENTIAAFDMALDAGFANIELDTHLSADGVPVVIHDDTLDRTTDGSGPVSSLTLAQLKRLDAGGWFGSDDTYVGAVLPTLEEVLERYAGRAHLHLELKSRDPDLPKVVIGLLRDRDRLAPHTDDPFAVPGLTITSFQFDQLERSIALTGRGVRHGWLLQEITSEAVRSSLDTGISGIYPRASNATAETTRLAVQSGMSVRGWGVNDDDDLSQLYRANAAGTTVNWPDTAQETLNSLSGHLR